MNTINRRTRLASLLAITTVTIAGVVAVGAQPASAYGVVQTDDVSINRVGFDIGGRGFSAGAPTSPADLEWSTAWFANIPEVDGYLHFEGVANNCARVRVISYDAAGVAMLPADVSPDECVATNGHLRRAFNVGAQLGAHEVEITLQTRINAAGAVWANIGSQTFTYGPTLGTDSVRISRAEVDFGTGVFAGGTAPSSGTLHWNVVNGYQISPLLTGTLYMNQSDDLCGRINLKYISSVLGVIDTTYGDEHCVTDDDLHTFAINHVNVAFADAAIDRVKVIIEVRPNGGAWATRGSVTVNLP